MKRRVAVAQFSSVLNDNVATLEKLAKQVAVAKAQGADLILFPEGFLGGYPKGSTFGAVVGNIFATGLDGQSTNNKQAEFLAYWRNSIALPGNELTRLCEIAREYAMHVVTGVIEREGGTLYCTVVFISNSGAYLGKHRKLMPTGVERLIWGCGDGSTMSTYHTDLGKIGAVICWENYMPLLRTYMYSQGIQLYLAPTADAGKGWLATMQHIAMEGSCFVLSCNQYLTAKDLYVNDTTATIPTDSTIMSGNSCIINPLGHILAGPVHDRETLLVADIDYDDIQRRHFAFDVNGHYSRPDIFTLSVNLRSQQTCSIVLE